MHLYWQPKKDIIFLNEVFYHYNFVSCLTRLYLSVYSYASADLYISKELDTGLSRQKQATLKKASKTLVIKLVLQIITNDFVTHRVSHNCIIVLKPKIKVSLTKGELQKF